MLNKFFEERYDYLLECAYNILKLRGKTELAPELVTEALLYFTENQDTEKFKSKIKKHKLETLVVRWMTMQILWTNTRFKNEFIYNDTNTVSLSNNVDGTESWLLDILEDYENKSEEEYLADEKEVRDKLISIAEFINNQPLDQQLLFRDVFINGFNSSGKLATHTGLSRTGCWMLIKTLKDNIKNNYQN